MVEASLTAVQSALQSAQPDAQKDMKPGSAGASEASDSVDNDPDRAALAESFEEMKAQPAPHQDAMSERVGRNLESLARGLQSEEAQLKADTRLGSPDASTEASQRTARDEPLFEAPDPFRDQHEWGSPYQTFGDSRGGMTDSRGLDPADASRQMQAENLKAMREFQASSERMSVRLDYQVKVSEVSTDLTNGLNTINKLLQAK